MSPNTAILCRSCQNHLAIPNGCACLSVVDPAAPCKLCGATAVNGFTEFRVGTVIEECLEIRKQHILFVEDVLNGIRTDLRTKIMEGRVPRTWNGKQLRKLIAEKAKAIDYVPMARDEKATYYNDVLVNNL